ncbi:hypothetical protein [Candidatus Protochlamydia sp. W-9]|uniref:hypothetical protein n=1 Tax=Candidatus Protochlamydia sp. W-9 TaxID=1785087 RepID=UPI00096A6590|nr:hypothetical protein [Candidatus Protochlamydia sp. W-9]
MRNLFFLVGGLIFMSTAYAKNENINPTSKTAYCSSGCRCKHVCVCECKQTKTCHCSILEKQ